MHVHMHNSELAQSSTNIKMVRGHFYMHICIKYDIYNTYNRVYITTIRVYRHPVRIMYINVMLHIYSLALNVKKWLRFFSVAFGIIHIYVDATERKPSVISFFFTCNQTFLSNSSLRVRLQLKEQKRFYCFMYIKYGQNTYV